MYVNCSNILHQMTRIDYDFTTPVGLEITPSDGKKKGEEQETEYKRVEGKRLKFL